MVSGYETPAESMPPALAADGPHPEMRAGLALFGQFVGTWDMSIRFFDRSGVVVFDQPGTWSFGWVLDGRCVQDILVYPHQGRTRPGERSIGTSLRHYDPHADSWRVIWLGAITGNLIVLEARAAGDEIHLTGQDVDGSPLRWMFSDIAPDRFHWHGLIDDGEGWRTEQEMIGTRRSEDEGGAPWTER